MSFRRRLLLLFAITVIVSVFAVAWIVSFLARRAFDRAAEEQTSALVSQFRSEFDRRGEEVSRRVQAASLTGQAGRIAVAAAQATPNYAPFLDDAQVVAETEQLNFLVFADQHGTIISSAQWPAKFGYQESLVNESLPSAPFLKEDETPSGPELGLFAVRTIAISDQKLYVIGGIRLDQSFLSTLELPAGMRVMLYENLGSGSTAFASDQLIAAGGQTPNLQDLAPVVNKVQKNSEETTAIVRAASGDDEQVHAFPLTGNKGQLLGILLVTNSRRIYTEFRGQIRSAAFLAAGIGLVLAVLLSSLAAARVTRPVEQLAGAARDIAAGNWNSEVAINSQDEIGELADSFNRMTRELIEQRERLVQAERVAAWRELARRLAHELKNPLFPLQLTVENLLRSREQSDQQFNETFRESATTLLAEIANLRNIIGRFSEFSRMPKPQFQEMDLNEVVESAAKVFQAQLERGNIICTREFSTSAPVAVDPDLIHRAVSNLISNAIEAMPQGGTLTLRTVEDARSARIEVSDTGGGLAAEDSGRLFTPYYTSKPHGTGLGLAIVQSVVSDHGGKVGVQSTPGKGTTFIIELPLKQERRSGAQPTHV